MYAASSETRNATAPPISLGLPSLKTKVKRADVNLAPNREPFYRETNTANLEKIDIVIILETKTNEGFHKG